MKEIIKAFHNQEIIKMKGSNYIINPLFDHEPETSYKLMKDAIRELSTLTDFSKANKIIGEEDRGGFIAALMAYKHKKSLAMVKWSPINLKRQISINFRNIYSEGKMYLYGVKKGDKIILVEDLIDSGGTIIAMIKLLKRAKVTIKDVICVAEKKENNGIRRIEKQTGIKVRCLLRFTCTGNKSKVIEVRNKKVNL